jgi:hypothetical protein
MQTWMIITLVSVVVLVALGWVVYDRRRSKRLQERFGPAYDQTVSEIGNRRRAEAELEWREAHARQLRSRPLNSADRERFLSLWKQCQARFVDDPVGAVEDADALLVQVMRDRGYAADNLYERTTDIAAAYPQHVERYRQAGEILERHRRSPVSTDSLRTAFLNYRNLFDDLIGAYDEKLKRAS